MILIKKSMITGREHDMFLDISEPEFSEAYKAWANGKLIQDAFPMLSATEREFIKTGITQEEWDATFPKEEEDDSDINSPWDGDFSY